MARPARALPGHRGALTRHPPACPGQSRPVPGGWADEQDAARYRLHERGDAALFGFAATAQSWKSILFPSRELRPAARMPSSSPSLAGTPTT
ncbi:MAG TPA: hypothetical protein VMV92_39570 [Streptosporangiaceae bacterium]|nr:hypothetical protein [Streptosporangiaceae bacterium]